MLKYDAIANPLRDPYILAHTLGRDPGGKRNGDGTVEAAEAVGSSVFTSTRCAWVSVCACWQVRYM